MVADLHLHPPGAPRGPLTALELQWDRVGSCVALRELGLGLRAMVARVGALADTGLVRVGVCEPR